MVQDVERNWVKLGGEWAWWSAASQVLHEKRDTSVLLLLLLLLLVSLAFSLLLSPFEYEHHFHHFRLPKCLSGGFCRP